MYTRSFWMAVSERALKTAVQFFIVIYGADLVNVFDADWRRIIGLSLSGLLISVATSLASTLAGPPGPSLTTERVAVPADRPGRHARPE